MSGVGSVGGPPSTLQPVSTRTPSHTPACTPSTPAPNHTTSLPTTAGAAALRRPLLSRQESSFDRALAALREVARDTHQAAAIESLIARFTSQLAELTEKLGEHYQKLLAGSGPRVGAAAGAGAGAGVGLGPSMSTREELDSLLNLIERIDVGGEGGRGGAVAAALGGMRLVGV